MCYLICQYESWLPKTTTMKNLAWEMGISIREAERHLDTYLFFRWIPKVGIQQAPPHIHPTMEFGPCRNHWVKGNMAMESGKATNSNAIVGCKCGGSCHWHHRPQDHLRGDYSIIPQGLPVKRATGTVPGDPKEMEESTRRSLTHRRSIFGHRWDSTQPEEPE